MRLQDGDPAAWPKRGVSLSFALLGIVIVDVVVERNKDQILVLILEQNHDCGHQDR
jgi:hypothetical protein